MILGSSYFLFKFDNEEDRERVLLEGPWTVQGHYLVVCQQTPEFTPLDDFIETTLAWVRFPEISVMYYAEDVYILKYWNSGKN